MNVVFLTQNAPFYIGRYFDRILERLKGGPVEVTALYAFPSHVHGKGFLGTLWYYLWSYYGVCLFARLALKRVWFAIRDTLGLTRRADSLRRVCRRHGVPLRTPKALTDAVKQELRDLKPDVLFSVGCPIILPRDVIDLPARACLNIHSALLPKYRGANPVFWARYHGEREIGVTIHLVDEGIDTGPILMQEGIEMGEDWSIDDAYEPIFEAGSRLMAECLTRLAAGKGTGSVCGAAALGGEPSAPAGGCATIGPFSAGRYWGFPTRADVKAFRRRGGSV